MSLVILFENWSESTTPEIALLLWGNSEVEIATSIEIEVFKRDWHQFQASNIFQFWALRGSRHTIRIWVDILVSMKVCVLVKSVLVIEGPLQSQRPSCRTIQR